MFLVAYALFCLGFFCGPVLELVSSTWRNQIPQGFWALTSLVLAAGIAIFSWEGYSQSEALYASVIVGTFFVSVSSWIAQSCLRDTVTSALLLPRSP